VVPALTDRGWKLLVNGKPLWNKSFTQVWHQTFSPDATKVAAVACPTFGRWTVVVDGDLWEPTFGHVVLRPVFSQDGRRIGAAVKDEETWTVAVDGIPWSEEFEMIWDPVFSPDGEFVATRAERGGRHVLVVNDKVSRQSYQALWEPIFSPDGTKLLIKAIEDGRYLRRVVPVTELIR
jgi:hypothetical protein